MRKQFVFLIIFTVLSACGGRATPTPDRPAPISSVPTLFPPFVLIRSDFCTGIIGCSEGLASNPLKVAMPPCVNFPVTHWQIWLCSLVEQLPTIYPVTNSFSSGLDPYYAWIISSNNEFLQTDGCNSGPPNQSLGPNEYPFSLKSTPQSLTLTVAHDLRKFCGKIPYMSATYIRGVQGDAKSNMFTWRGVQGKKLELDINLARTDDDSAWFRVLLHFRDPRTGQRYIVNKDYVMPDYLPIYAMSWNWPYINSFQYPGAKIIIPARIPADSLKNGANHISINLADMALIYFPEFSAIEPDFLGVEIAVEIGPVINSNSVEILAISLD